MKESPQLLQTRTVYSSKTFSVREDRVRDDGREHTWSIVEHPGAYAILAQPDPASVLLVRQYRQPAGRRLLEIPAGTADAGETPAQGALRELAEETGYRAGRIEPAFAAFTTPGFCTEFMHFFHATELQAGPVAFDSDEAIETLSVRLDKALALLDDGEIADAKTAAGLLWLDRQMRQQFR